MAYFCPYCGDYTGVKFNRHLQHIRFHHSNEPNFSISCGDCGQPFKKFESFKSHVRRKHRNQHVLTLSEELNMHRDEAEMPENMEEYGLDGEVDMDPHNAHDSVEELTRFLALFILKTKETNNLSQQAINAITCNTAELVEFSLNTLKSDILQCLHENGISVNTINGLENVLERKSAFCLANEHLSTEYLQMKYFVEKFNFIQPTEVVLSHRVEEKIVRGCRKSKIVKESFQYISILQTLKALLQHPEVLEEIRSSHHSTDGSMRDFCDGTDYKSHGLFSQNPSSLILHCYFDEFQTANPLGSKTKKHKLGAFYFSLGNMKICHRSSMNMIFLFALCKVPILKKFNPNKVMEPFMNDIKKLEAETGWSIKVEEKDQIFRGSIGPFSADNLGAHTIAGFLESFSSLRICRICMATKEDIQCKFHEEEFQLRTVDGHDRQCELVKDDPLVSTVYGVKRRSNLCDSQFFHVIGGMDLDVMHDQLEGVLPKEIKLLLSKYIHGNGYFNLDVLNYRLQGFNYGAADTRNKPSEIKSVKGDSTLGQSASQMWCLARMLPLVIGDLVPENEPHWEHFLCLLQIEEIVFAQRSTVQLAAYLSVLVDSYLREYTSLYEKPVTPKQHYMVHYPRQIIKRGPLVRNWSMRFEAKHHYFKKLVGTINNFKNIEYSLAKRHQALQAYLMQTSRNLFSLSLEHGPGEKVNINENTIPINIHEVGEESNINRVSWIKVCGTMYTKKSVIAVSLIRGQLTFGEIVDVFVVNSSTVIFYYEELRVLNYVHHFNAYKVHRSNIFAYVKQENMADSHPLGIHTGFDDHSQDLFVVLKYRIDCMLEY